MTTRVLTLGLGLALLATVAGNYLLETPGSFATARTLLAYGPEAARLLAWGLLVSGGTIIGTWYFRLSLWLGGGLLEPVMHWWRNLGDGTAKRLSQRRYG